MKIDNIENVYICGPPTMNLILPKLLLSNGFNKDKLIIVWLK